MSYLWTQNIIVSHLFQCWAFPFLNKMGKMFLGWIAEMEKDGVEPDDLVILFMSHYLGRNITLVLGKAEEWNAEDIADDILLIYCGDNLYTLTDVGICHFFCFVCLLLCVLNKYVNNNHIRHLYYLVIFFLFLFFFSTKKF